MSPANPTIERHAPRSADGAATPSAPLAPSDLATTVIVGATSSIGRAVLERLAAIEPKARYVLISRQADELQRIAADVRARRNIEADVFPADLAEPGGIDRLAADLAASPGRIRGVVLAHGAMADQDDAMQSPESAAHMIAVNFAGSVRLIGALLPMIKAGGFVCAISSVAGDRGRPSNFIYGSSKAGLNTYIDGLRATLKQDDRRITVTTIKPGFTDTAMTYGLDGMFLVAPPERVAADTIKGIRRGAAIVYTPWFWRWIMLIIRSIPRPVFDRMKL